MILYNVESSPNYHNLNAVHQLLLYACLDYAFMLKVELILIILIAD